ncbi:hypothetical protein BO86DRAFT_47424 [Aspergillus japonicus CBS 114.51]|uniref:Uncharacterized protein n=1 Tax=Aspergillus japonicus CBS 114.51 TaxID=1448312 RepID=A0A8T8X5P0_ASPJA|nr:hypothetical protein BO86DRAFT_47424 [Aspergillus japonicus CBS 114.51]RAH83356.1 hypothetical protein BO86DRAFT_47424 [Aspergillus japonicus CBS 114.51]
MMSACHAHTGLDSRFFWEKWWGNYSYTSCAIQRGDIHIYTYIHTSTTKGSNETHGFRFSCEIGHLPVHLIGDVLTISSLPALEMNTNMLLTVAFLDPQYALHLPHPPLNHVSTIKQASKQLCSIPNQVPPTVLFHAYIQNRQCTKSTGHCREQSNDPSPRHMLYSQLNRVVPRSMHPAKPPLAAK